MSIRNSRTDRAILALAAPAIINNITIPLLGLCDTAISGHLGDSSYMAAMAVGSMMINVVYWLCGFLRMGTSGMAAQAFGASNFANLHRILRKALKIGAVIASIVIIIQLPLRKLLLLIISPDTAVYELASAYFSIGIWGAPAQLCIMAASGWFVGRQNTVIPMFVSIGVNVVNILLSLFLVYVVNLGFYGIIAGTLVSAYVGAVTILAIAYSKVRGDRRHQPRSPAPALSEENKKGFLSVNVPLFLRSVCIMAVTMGMTSAGARMGATSLAVNAVIMQFFMFFSYFMDGFAFAGEALVGKYAGAGDLSGISESVKGLMRWGAYMAAAFFVVYFLFSGNIVNLLTDVEDVRTATRAMTWWLVALPPITVAAFIFDGIFIGMTRTMPLLWCTLIASAAFFVISFAAGLPSNPLLWTGFEAYLLLRGALLGMEYLKIQRKSLIL